MKTLVKFFSPALFLALFAIPAYAEIDPATITGISFSVTPVDDTKAVIRVINSSENKLSLTIRDERNNLLFSDAISKKSPSLRKLNFSNLEDGAYTLTIRGENQLVRQPFAVKNGSVAFDENPMTKFFQPSIVQQDNGLLFRVVHTAPSAVFSIWDASGRTIYEETITDNVVAKVYNLTKLPAGKYTAGITTGVKHFEKQFSL
jgi:hypothetical protein